MSALDDYRASIETRERMLEWMQLVGRAQHFGDGRGGTVHNVAICIHHQASPGATNYHDAPADGKAWLTLAVSDAWATILALADKRMLANIGNQRNAAIAEYQTLFGDADLARAALAQARGTA